MQSGRWTAAAIVAVLLAAAPGAAALIPAERGFDRALAPIGRSAAPAPAVPPPGAEAVVPPTEDLTGELAPAVPAPPAFTGEGEPGEVFAVVAGIDDYPGSAHDLRWAGADAQTVDAALAGFGVPSGNRMVLRDGQARRAGLEAAIAALVAQARPGATLVLAFAGHVRKLDADTEALVAADGGLITDAELAALLAPVQSGQLWVLLAACYAGGFTEILAPGRILTGAADAGSLAYESSAIGGSYLIHHMVREGWLEGRAGTTVQEAFAYADAAMASQGQRRPEQVDLAGGPVRLGLLPITAAPPPPAPASPASPPTTAPAPPTQAEPTAPPPPPPGTPEATDPDRRCSLLVICRR